MLSRVCLTVLRRCRGLAKAWHPGTRPLRYPVCLLSIPEVGLNKDYTDGTARSSQPQPRRVMLMEYQGAPAGEDLLGLSHFLLLRR